MALKGFRRNFKPLQILTEEEVEAIHRGTLEVLWVTGVRVEHKRALKLFEKNGCKVDYNEMRVRFPSGLVEESLRRCPSSFVIKARNPRDNVVIGGDVTYFKNSCGMQITDLDTWEPRVATRKENYDGVTVLDDLGSLHILGPFTPYFGFEGVPPAMAMPESCASKIRNSTKVQIEGFSNASEIFQIEMAKAVGAEILQQVLASPPMTWYKDAIEALFRAVEAGFPVAVESGPTLGGTAPVTLAGAMITNNAELISAIVLAQIIKPGTRVVADDFVFPMNMKSGAPAFGAIGSSLHQVAFNQIWRGYGIPVYNVTSGYLSSKSVDFQAGYEKAIQGILSGVSGANIIGLHGSVSSAITFHPIQAILDDDLAGMIGRFVQGIEINDETLAIDLIEEVGPIPGHFLNKEHTRKWWKLEQFVPQVADRLTYPEWMKTGKKSCLDYAKERMKEILATHKPISLTPSQEEDIEKILEEARKYYKERGLMSEEEMAIYTESIKSPNYPCE